MQLLRIQTVPIEYRFQVEHARLEMKQADNAQVRVRQEPAKITAHTRNISVRLDTTDMRYSMGLKNVSDVIADNAKRGKQAALKAVGEMSSFGKQLGRIDKGVTVSQLVTQKMWQQPETVTVFLPSVGPSISWVPNQINKEYTPGVLEMDWQINKNVMDYIPGKFQIIIEQYPSVKIEYLGEPQYVPPSSNPHYEAS